MHRAVPRKLNGWQWFQIWCGRLALIAIGLTAAVITPNWYIIV